jgi:hypothetical protein
VATGGWGATQWLQTLEGELRKTAPFEDGILREAQLLRAPA